jgi:DNA-binding winged helix-turn-helix (wHTH) protein/tetratricopeptide (TPR) repeat protein
MNNLAMLTRKAHGSLRAVRMLKFRHKEGGYARMTTSESQRVSELYEFGPFRVDTARETLLRSGEPVRLTPKTFQILLVLVRHGKEVVTKDDLMKTVWPDTFVEEANLSRNIFMLRKALGEPAQDRQYILTVPGRGYRLTEDVHLVPQQEFAIVAASHSKVELHVKEGMSWVWFVAIVVFLLVASVGTRRWTMHRRVLLSGKGNVVLADFANSTGDTVFDGTLRQGMAVQLEQSPFLNLITEERIQQTLRLMGQVGNEPLTPGLAREVCERIGSAAVLEGSIASLGNQYVLGLRATNCRTGDVLDEEQVQVARKEDVLSSLSQIAAKYRTRVGESLATVAKHNTPLAEAATPSLEALKAYSAGWKALSSTGPAAALPLFRRATEIDPQFAMAHAMLGRAYGDMGETILSVKSTARAYELQGHVSDQEKFFIVTSYDMVVTGNLERARQACEAWEQTYPQELKPHIFLAGIIYPVLGRYEEAVEEAKKAVDADSSFAIGYNVLAMSYQALNRLDEAEQTLRNASERNLEISDSLTTRYQLAFLKDDQAAMKDVSATALKQSSVEDAIVDQESFAEAYVGHLQEATRKSQHAMNLAQQASEPDRAAMYEAGAAVREALFGEVTTATESARAVLRLSRSGDAEYGAAFALALAGDQLQAATLAGDLERRFPENTAVRFNYAPTLRALLALKHGDPSHAVDLLRVSIAHELGEPQSSFFGLYGTLYPIYMRGEAYLALNRGPEAAIEFQKIIDHRGIVVSDPIGALAHLQLGRAFVSSGDKTRAKTAYGDFLTLWKDADSNIPILKQARLEYVKLQ